MQSNESLDIKIKNMEENNRREHKDMFGIMEKIETRLGKFIDKAEYKYSTKEENKAIQDLQKVTNDNMQKDINKHSKNFEKLSWFVILGVLAFIGQLVLTLVNQ